MDAMKRRGLTGFWLERGWIGDLSNCTYAKCKHISDYFSKWGGFGFRGVYWFVCDVSWVSGIVGWPDTNTNSLLVSCRDFKFRIGNKGVKSLVPTDEEPRVIDKFKG
jgi:hypothetical protein